jgi:hypothetical protein
MFSHKKHKKAQKQILNFLFMVFFSLVRVAHSSRKAAKFAKQILCSQRTKQGLFSQNNGWQNNLLKSAPDHCRFASFRIPKALSEFLRSAVHHSAKLFDCGSPRRFTMNGSAALGNE